LATIFAQIGASGKDICVGCLRRRGQLLAAAGAFIITDYRRFGCRAFSLLPAVFAFE
jgi:hypothetical protein